MNLKDSFPECLHGVSIAEYDHNVIPERDEKEIDGMVIDNLRPDGQKSRMEQIREEFVEPEKDPKLASDKKPAKKKKAAKKKPEPEPEPEMDEAELVEPEGSEDEQEEEGRSET